MSICMLTANSIFAKSANIMLVSQIKSLSAVTDFAIQKHLQNLGYDVQVVDQTQSPNQIKNIDLVIISSTVASKNLKQGWRQLAIPLLTWENDYLDDLAMTGKRSDTDFGEVEKDRHLWMVNAPHPLSANLAAGTLNVYQAQAPMSWGKPGLGATIIATIYGQPEKPAIWAYEKGATMDYETVAPAKRMMFFLNNDTFTNLNPDGVKLFDTAIIWLLSHSQKG
ncbi:hypothetical protein B9T28_09360 [Acinetobacter silvestris]|uniref:Lipoprotein transmembrane n=2 Tax=Acinetobacter silvestris TaxID=1977882 RepID=A0A1Y3CI09_9GAMM|nr:hypothetical protein B9T28_09360 [Acinetobacter silvestris]